MGSVYAVDVMFNAAKMTGYPVSEVSGWKGRGHGGFRVVEGIVMHHTADGPNGNYPSLGIVTYGRSDLVGPLANIGLGRDGTVYLIAAGVGWHSGASEWRGFRDLNDEFIGIEAESTGIRDDWTQQQRDCYPRLCAAICYYIRRGAERVCGHKECCLPRGRKIDPAFWDMAQTRQKVGWYLADPIIRIPKNGSAPQPVSEVKSNNREGGTMFLGLGDKDKNQLPDRVGLLSGGIFRELDGGYTATVRDTIERQGALYRWVDQTEWDWWCAVSKKLTGGL